MEVRQVVVEVCVDSVASAMAAARGGARRLELCASLFTGGETPSSGMVRRVRELLPRGGPVALHVLLRPRGGDFIYTADDEAAMAYDIDTCAALGVDGVVLGALRPDGSIDVDLCARLIGRARAAGMAVTFHRAFDHARDPMAALEDVVALGCSRLLSSGQERSAVEGAPLLRLLVQRAAGRLVVMPGGGVTDRNVARLLRETGASEVHMSASRWVPSEAEHRPSHVPLGGSLAIPDFSLKLCDAALVSSVCSIVSSSL